MEIIKKVEDGYIYRVDGKEYKVTKTSDGKEWECNNYLGKTRLDAVGFARFCDWLNS